jgi:hypothetical protein
MSTRTKESKPWTETEARRVLNEQAASGEKVWTFATKRGLVPERLYRWQRKLGPVASKPRKNNRVSPKRRMRFAEVSHPAEALRVEAGRTEKERLEVVLTSGRRISVPSGFCGEDMRRLVAVLEGAAC